MSSVSMRLLDMSSVSMRLLDMSSVSSNHFDRDQKQGISIKDALISYASLLQR